MADQSTQNTGTPNSGGSNTAMAFILGAIVVVLGFIVWAIWGDGFAPRDAEETSIEITVPDSVVPDAGAGADAGGEAAASE